MGGAHIGHYGVLELTDFGLECVASIEEDDFIAAFFHKLVYLFGFEVHATADHAVFVYLKLVGSAKRHDFIACFDRQTREVFGTALRPFEFHVLEAGVLAGLFGVRLNRADFAAERAVNAVFGNEDAPAQTELLAQGTLPEHDRHGVGYGGKLVIQDNSILSHPPILRFLGTSCVPWRRRSSHNMTDNPCSPAGCAHDDGCMWCLHHEVCLVVFLPPSRPLVSPFSGSECLSAGAGETCQRPFECPRRFTVPEVLQWCDAPRTFP